MENSEIIQKQPTQLAATTGFLDQIAIENETVCLSGWILSFESQPIDNFKILFGGKQFTEFELTQGIPSPGVKKAHPNIEAANNARFIIRLPMNQQQQQQLKDALIIIIPLVAGREGEPLLNAVTPALSELIKTSESQNLPTETPQVELISVHVPKAAGTAFRQVLLQVYGTQGVLTDKTNMFEDNMPATIHWQTKVIEGHFRAGKYDKLFPNTKRITWLRQPIRRLISDYCFRHISNPTKDHLNKESLLKFAEGNNNLMAYCVNGQPLDYFEFVGITEYFEEDLLALKKILGWGDYQVIYQNRNPYPEYVAFQKEVLSDKNLIAELEAANSQDMALYEAALKLREQRKNLPEKVYQIPTAIPTPEQTSTPKKIASIPTVGSLDKAEFDNQELHLIGWVVSPNSGAVKSFNLTIANTTIEKFELALGLPSPDVKKLHPNLNNSGRARFRLKVSLNPEQILQFQNAPVVLTPIFKDGEGQVLSKVLGAPKQVTFPEAPPVQKQPKIIPPIESIATAGHLDETAIANQRLLISGWVGSFEFGPVEAFKVVIGGQEFTSFEQKLGLPSPDVAKARPKLNNAKNARFRLQIPLTPEQLQNCQNSLIALTPIFQGRSGEILFQFFNPSLPIPSNKYIDGGANHFIQRSLKFLGDFIQKVGLQPTAEVLEVGCGVGNIAYGLAYYLQSPGRYEGFDFSGKLISWAQQNITAYKSNFNFRQLDSDFQFPYDDESFDFVFVSSRFTQVGGAEIRHYLDEIYRVLKPQGRFITNCFLVNSESQKLISKNKSSQLFHYRLQEGFTKDPHSPEKGIGFQESLFLEWVSNAGFGVLGKFYGSWCGRVGSSNYPDMLIFRKEEKSQTGILKGDRGMIQSSPNEQVLGELETVENSVVDGLNQSSEKPAPIPSVNSVNDLNPTELSATSEILITEVNKQEEIENLVTEEPKQLSEDLQPNLPLESAANDINPTVIAATSEILITGVNEAEEIENSATEEPKQLSEDLQPNLPLESTAYVSPVLAEIMADLRRSQSEIQQLQADLERFKSKQQKKVEPDTHLQGFGDQTPTKQQKKPEIKLPVKPDTDGEGLGDQTPTKKKIITKPVEQVVQKQKLPTPPPEQKQELLGLSGVTVAKFWEIIDPLIQGLKPNSKPAISILTPTWNSSLDWFVETVLSVLNQSIPNWEWCIVDDGSKQPEIRNVLAGLAEKELRIKVLFSENNGGISAATNKALNMATGEYICLLDHDDTLTPTALEDSLNKLAEGFDVVYSDEDKIDFSGLNYIVPFFKPDWSPEYFRGVMYVGHLLCVRREIALAAGGFKSEFDGVQDYEFMLRVSEQTNKIAHISKHLYHWRQVKGSISGDADAKAGIETVQQAAVNAHLERIGLAAKAEPGLGRHRVNINPLPQDNYPLISIIIATPNISENLDKWLENLLSVSTYPNNEVILVGGNQTENIPDNILQNPAVKVLCGLDDQAPTVSGNFNYSRAYNFGAKTAQGEYLVFLNTNVEVAVEDWQRHLLYYAEQSDVGAVGGLLIFPDGKVEHAGIVLGKSGKVNYVMRGFSSDHDGYAGSLICAREVSAVSRDCLMVSRKNFELVGGFNEHFFNDYQDVDLCLKLRKNGKRIVFTPRSVLINHESEKHRQENYDVVDYMLLLDQWQVDMDLGDPYFNLNFDIQKNDYSVVSTL